MSVSLGDAVWTIKGDLSGLNRALGDAKKNVQGAMGNMLQAGRTLGIGMAVVGTGIGVALGSSVVQAAKFEKAIINAASVTGKTGNEFTVAKEKMESLAKTLGVTTVFSATQAANAFYDLSSKGFDVASMSVQELEPILDLAAATQSNLTQATEVTTSTLRGFGMENKDLARVSDVMAMAIGKSASKLEFLGVSMPIAATSAKLTGVSFEELSAALGILYDKGIDASTAATGLRNVMKELNAPTGTFKKALEELEIPLTQTSLQNQTLAESLEGLVESGMDVNTILQAMGKRNGDVAASLAGATSELKKFHEKLLEAKGTAHTMATTQLKSLANKFELLKAAIEGVNLEMGAALTPSTGGIMDTLAALLRWVAKWMQEHPKITAGLTFLAAGFAAVALAAGTLLIAAVPLTYLIASGLGPAIGAAAIVIPILIAKFVLLGIAIYAGIRLVKEYIETLTQFRLAADAETEAQAAEAAHRLKLKELGFDNDRQMHIKFLFDRLNRLREHNEAETAEAVRHGMTIFEYEQYLMDAIIQRWAQHGNDTTELEANLQEHRMKAIKERGEEEIEEEKKISERKMTAEEKFTLLKIETFKKRLKSLENLNTKQAKLETDFLKKQIAINEKKVSHLVKTLDKETTAREEFDLKKELAYRKAVEKTQVYIAAVIKEFHRLVPVIKVQMGKVIQTIIDIVPKLEKQLTKVTKAFSDMKTDINRVLDTLISEVRGKFETLAGVIASMNALAASAPSAPAPAPVGAGGGGSVGGGGGSPGGGGTASNVNINVIGGGSNAKQMGSAIARELRARGVLV